MPFSVIKLIIPRDTNRTFRGKRSVSYISGIPNLKFLEESISAWYCELKTSDLIFPDWFEKTNIIENRNLVCMCVCWECVLNCIWMSDIFLDIFHWRNNLLKLKKVSTNAKRSVRQIIKNISEIYKYFLPKFNYMVLKVYTLERSTCPQL